MTGPEFEELHRLRAQVKELRAENLEYDIQRKEAIVEIEDFAKELRDAYARIQAAHDEMDRIEKNERYHHSVTAQHVVASIREKLGYDGVKLKETP